MAPQLQQNVGRARGRGRGVGCGVAAAQCAWRSALLSPWRAKGCWLFGGSRAELGSRELSVGHASCSEGYLIAAVGVPAVRCCCVLLRRARAGRRELEGRTEGSQKQRQQLRSRRTSSTSASRGASLAAVRFVLGWPDAAPTRPRDGAREPRTTLQLARACASARQRSSPSWPQQEA